MDAYSETCYLELKSCFFLILAAGYLDIDGLRNLDEALQ